MSRALLGYASVAALARHAGLCHRVVWQRICAAEERGQPLTYELLTRPLQRGRPRRGPRPDQRPHKAFARGLAEAVRRAGSVVKYHTARSRVRSGWSVAAAVSIASESTWTEGQREARAILTKWARAQHVQREAA